MPPLVPVVPVVLELEDAWQTKFTHASPEGQSESLEHVASHEQTGQPSGPVLVVQMSPGLLGAQAIVGHTWRGSQVPVLGQFIELHSSIWQ